MQNIRDYRDSDFEDVKTCLVEGGLFDPIWDSSESYRKMMEKQPGSIVVAEADGETVGVLFLSFDGRAASIETFAIKTRYRRNGIGGFMIKEADDVHLYSTG